MLNTEIDIYIRDISPVRDHFTTRKTQNGFRPTRRLEIDFAVGIGIRGKFEAMAGAITPFGSVFSL